MALSRYGFAGNGVSKEEPVKPQRLTPVTATLFICAHVKMICRLACPPGIKTRIVDSVQTRWYTALWVRNGQFSSSKYTCRSQLSDMELNGLCR